jgi:very-short-patch-repair endonuclease
MQTQYEKLKELENKMKGKYLTEEWLGEILEAVFLGYEWVHDEKFQAHGETFNFRPDYCCHRLQMCIEFDGPDHYTKANVIQSDIKKNQIIEYNGYDIIRIPYFVQLNSVGIKYFFNLDIDLIILKIIKMEV